MIWRKRRVSASPEATEALRSARGPEVERAFKVLRDVSDTQERARRQRKQDHLADLIERALGDREEE